MKTDEDLIYEQANTLARYFDKAVWANCRAGAVGLASMMVAAKALHSAEGDSEQLAAWFLSGLSDACINNDLDLDWTKVCQIFLASRGSPYVPH